MILRRFDRRTGRTALLDRWPILHDEVDDAEAYMTVKEATPDLREEIRSGRPRRTTLYDVPDLPAALRATCELCAYDFAREEGQVLCDQSTCQWALQSKANVPAYWAWMELIAHEYRIATG